MQTPKTSKERVYDILDSCTRAHDVREADFFQASYIADTLHISRSLASQYMNELVGEGLLVKVASRPALFYSRRAIEGVFGAAPAADTFVSVDELMGAIQGSAHDSYDFEDLIGASGSLRGVVEQAKAACSYPPCGLPLMLVGARGSGREGIERAITRYCVSEGIIADETQALFVDAAKYGDEAVRVLTGDGSKPGALSSPETRVIWLINAQVLSDESMSALLGRFEGGWSDRPAGKGRRGTSRLFFEYDGDSVDVMDHAWARSIPALCFVPTLDERGAEEKEAWIFRALRHEERNIGRPIKVSRSVAARLVSRRFADNIDGLKRTVSLTCASAMADADNQGTPELKVFSYHIPGNDVSSLGEIAVVDEPGLIDVDLYDPSQGGAEAIDVLTRFMSLFAFDSVPAGDSEQGVEAQAKSVLSGFFEYVERDRDALIGETTVADIVRQVFEHNCLREPVNFSRHLVASAHFFRNNRAAVNRWRNESGPVIRAFGRYARQKYAIEFEVIQHLRGYLQDYLGWRIDAENLALFSFYLHWHLRGQSTRSCQGVIVAHGHSTASSIADSVNTIIGEHVFDALDMPIDVSVEQVSARLQRFLSRSPLAVDVLVMVDMGSLERIGAQLSTYLGVSVGIINNVSTTLALEAGEMLIQQADLADILARVAEVSQAQYSLLQVRQTSDCIAFVSENGAMAATRIADLFIKSLPRPIPVEMVPCDLFDLVRNRDDLSRVTSHNILFAFGATDPGLPGVNFLSLEGITELRSNDGLSFGLENYLSSEEVSELKSNLVRNFSLENLMHHLTILEPNHLMDVVSASIDLLQTSLGKTFTYGIRMRLYIHISYLVERLVTKVSLNYGDSDAFAHEHADFLRRARTSFTGVTRAYGVEIPVGEINYLYDLIEAEGDEGEPTRDVDDVEGFFGSNEGASDARPTTC